VARRVVEPLVLSCLIFREWSILSVADQTKELESFKVQKEKLDQKVLELCLNMEASCDDDVYAKLEFERQETNGDIKALSDKISSGMVERRSMGKGRSMVEKKLVTLQALEQHGQTLALADLKRQAAEVAKESFGDSPFRTGAPPRGAVPEPPAGTSWTASRATLVADDVTSIQPEFVNPQIESLREENSRLEAQVEQLLIEREVESRLEQERRQAQSAESKAIFEQMAENKAQMEHLKSHLIMLMHGNANGQGDARLSAVGRGLVGSGAAAAAAPAESGAGAASQGAAEESAETVSMSGWSLPSLSRRGAEFAGEPAEADENAQI
jgi:hypothetical protein